MLHRRLSRTRSGAVMNSMMERPQRLRVAFYSHDTMGMGHLRRNLLIASAVAEQPVNAEVLIVSGAGEAAFFSEQAGLDCVTLPTLYKNLGGQYTARHFDWSLDRIIHFRSRIVTAALECFQPDVFVVDKVPRGIGNELDPILKQLRRKGRTHCVLGLRDVLDEPDIVQREWKNSSSDHAIERYFDEIWIYGDPRVYDGVKEYEFCPDVARKARFTGYLDQATRLNGRPFIQPEQSDRGDGPMALCVVGGGQDGFELAAAFVLDGVPSGWTGVVITGPCMPIAQRKQLNQLGMQHPEIQIIDRLVETDEWLSRATRIVAMGGYNTLTSILSFCKPALIVPRIKPRREQWIRAERLQSLGWTSVLSPDNLQPGAIRRWLETDTVPTPMRTAINLNGLQAISQQLLEIVPDFVRC